MAGPHQLDRGARARHPARKQQAKQRASKKTPKLMQSHEASERADGHGGPMTPPMIRPVTPRMVLLVDDHQMLTEALAARLAGVATCVSRVGAPPTTRGYTSWSGSCGRTCSPSRSRPLETMSRTCCAAWPMRARAAASWCSAPTGTRNAIARGPRRCGRLGAEGGRAAQLIAVLRGVCIGHSWFPPDLLGPVLRGLRTDIRQASDGTGPLDMLSPRELDVLGSMMDGRHGPQIAERLSISVETVRTHTRSILAKLGVRRRLAAVRVARSAGLERS